MRPANIPKWPYAFFKFYCKHDRFEEMHGDLEEYFYERLATKGMVKARLLYTRDVLRCCQPYAWKKPKAYSNSNIIMFKNYFKTATRSAYRNPLSTFINLFGLSIAVGVCIMVYAFYNQSVNTDRFHENKDRVFLSTIHTNRDGNLKQYGFSPVPLADYLEADFEVISNTCRVEDVSTVVQLNDQVYYENIRMVDDSFLEMFSFPLKWGNANALKDVNSIILSNRMAEKYFDGANPLGQEVLVIFKSGEKKYFEVSGVAEPFPDAAELSFNFLINYENIDLSIPGHDPGDWSAFLDATFIQVEDPLQMPALNAKLKEYASLQNDVNQDWQINRFELISIHDLYLASENINRALVRDVERPGRMILPYIAGFMLLLACLNYINMAISSVAKRLKEIGVRKVMGANKRKVMVQFLVENMVTTSFALFFGLFLGISLFMPWFEGISGDEYSIQVSDQLFYLFLLGLLITIGLASGVYPAFYISKFEAVSIFKGRLKLGRKGFLTKAFLGLQIILACVTITGAVVFVQNTNFQTTRSWGYDQSDVLYVRTVDKAIYNQMHAELSKLPGIGSLTGSAHHIAGNYRSSVVEFQEDKFEVSEYMVEPDYFETLGLKLQSGTWLTPNLQIPAKELVVNETFVRSLGLQEALGAIVKLREGDYRITGVVKDFHAASFATKIEPMVFSPVAKEDLKYLVAELPLGQEVELYTKVEKIWDELYPEVPMHGGLQANIWDGYFMLISNFARFNKAVAMIAVILALLGLYGLMTLNISGRIKEFSVRKTLGANMFHLGKIMSKDYMWLTLISLALGAPMGYFAIKFQLGTVFEYPLPMGASRLIIPVTILVFLLVLVIASQVFKVMKFNPIKGLRSE